MVRKTNTQITRRLRHELFTKRPTVGTRVFAYDDLYSLYGLSPASSKKVLEPLEVAGYIEIRAHVGVFVVAIPQSAADPDLGDMLDELAENVAALSVRVDAVRDAFAAAA